MTGVAMIGSIIGPPLAGWVFDNRGSYQGIWFVLAGLAIAAIISVATISSANTTIQSADKK